MNRSIISGEDGARLFDQAQMDDQLLVHSIARALHVLSVFHKAEQPLSLN